MRHLTISKRAFLALSMRFKLMISKKELKVVIEQKVILGLWKTRQPETDIYHCSFVTVSMQTTAVKLVFNSIWYILTQLFTFICKLFFNVVCVTTLYRMKPTVNFDDMFVEMMKCSLQNKNKTFEIFCSCWILASSL